MPPAAEDAHEPRPAVTDSPWFWVLVFSVAALVALLLISGQYAKRQRRLEMQYQARQEMTRRQVAGEPRARAVGLEGEDAPPAPGELIIPLWPLVAVLVLVVGVSGYMLWLARTTSGHHPRALSRGDPP